MQLWDYVWLRVTTPDPGGNGRAETAEDAWLDLLRDAGQRGWEAVAAVVVPDAARPSGALRILLKRPAGSAHPHEVR